MKFKMNDSARHEMRRSNPHVSRSGASFRIFSSPAAVVIALLIALTCGADRLRAAEPKVEASLSDDHAELGQSVELQIKVTGADKINLPNKIDLDGVEIRQGSQSWQTSANYINGSLSLTKTAVFTFPVIPKRTGVLTIPAITLDADGNKLTTQAKKLTVTNGGSPGTGGNSSATGANPPPDDASAESSNEIATAELVVPKQDAYVGESIPIEVRFYFNLTPQVQISQVGAPKIDADGFTLQKLTDAKQKKIERGGKSYICLSYKTAMTPVKTGKLLAGPVEVPYLALVSTKRRTQRPRMNDPFESMLSDPFFNGIMNPPEQRQLTVTGSGVEINVHPLPAKDRPESFNGAVGQFKMETQASPLRVSVGDPVTMNTKITGRGNFDRVTAPVMEPETGWRSYPPSTKFNPDDDTGTSGTKVFEMAVIPEQKKSSLPVVRFSYFDPAEEKYVTLSSNPAAIAVEGSSPAPQQALAAQPQPAAGNASATPAPTPNANDILYRTDAARWGASFEPLYLQRSFWLAQLAPAFALLALLGFRIRSARKGDAEAQRQERFRREKSSHWKTLSSRETGSAEFYEAAARVLQIETARTSGRDPSSIGSDDALSARTLDPAVAEGVRAVFDARAELCYAGSSTRGESLPPERRDKVLNILRNFENAKS